MSSLSNRDNNIKFSYYIIVSLELQVVRETYVDLTFISSLANLLIRHRVLLCSQILQHQQGTTCHSLVLHREIQFQPTHHLKSLLEHSEVVVLIANGNFSEEING